MQNNIDNIPLPPPITSDEAVRRMICGYENTVKYNWHMKECLDEQVKIIERLESKIYFLERAVLQLLVEKKGQDNKTMSEVDFEMHLNKLTKVSDDLESSFDKILFH